MKQLYYYFENIDLILPKKPAGFGGSTATGAD